MANTSIAIPEPLQRQVGPLAERFAKERAELCDMANELKDRPITEMTAALAIEYDTRAKSFEAKAKKAFAPMITVAFKTHRSLTGILHSVCEPVGQLRRLASSKISAYALEVEKAKQVATAPAQRAEIVEREDETLKGVSLVPMWEGEIKDFAKFVDHIAAHHELLFLLLPVQGDLNRYVTRMKGKVEIPGVGIIQRMVKRNRNSDE